MTRTQGQENIGAGEKGFKLDYSFIWVVYFIYLFFVMNAVRLEQKYLLLCANVDVLYLYIIYIFFVLIKTNRYT